MIPYSSHLCFFFYFCLKVRIDSFSLSKHLYSKEIPLKLQWRFGINSSYSIKVPLAVQEDFPVHFYILIFDWRYVCTVYIQYFCKKSKDLLISNTFLYFFCLENILVLFASVVRLVYFSFLVFGVLSRCTCLLLLWKLWKSKTCKTITVYYQW